MRPLVSGGSASGPSARKREHGDARGPSSARGAGGASPGATRAVRERANAVKVRKLARGVDDGFASPLLPGLKSSEDAGRLVDEVAFAAARLKLMNGEAGGVWAEISDPAADLEARTRLALESVLAGDRGVSGAGAVASVTAAYDAWVARAGSQAGAFTGEPAWTPERRFARVFERLAFGGLTRDARFELLVLLGRLGLYELNPGSLQLTGENEATWAAKRAMGIADVVLLERRVKEFAEACEAPLEALDLGLQNWGSGKRIGAGIEPATPGDPGVLASGRRSLGL